MKIQLPNGQQHILDEHISLDEKLKVVEDLTEEFMEIIKLNWNSNSVKFFLDSLTNYIVWHKEDREEGKRGLEDKEILSKKKLEKMVRFKKTSKTTNFSDLSKADAERLFGENGVRN